MAITFRILGAAGADNALLVHVDSGQSVERLLFDCGEGCLAGVPFSEISAIDHLFFTHFHMDHVAGFDSYFRCNFNRAMKANRVWGPPGTVEIMHHRFRSFLWNLHETMDGSWLVSDITPDEVRTTRFELREAFAIPHPEDVRKLDGPFLQSDAFSVEAVTMDHGTPVLAYIIREASRRNVDTAKLGSMGLPPGPWMQTLKAAPGAPDTRVELQGVSHSLADLQKALIVETPGATLAFLTDFLLDEPGMEALANKLHKCDTIVCESQYRHADVELALKHHHMTTTLTATLAQRARAKELVLLHLSSRYEPPVWMEMLAEARTIFPNTRFPEHWPLES